MDIRVYNAHQIGGCFTVISTKEARIMIDYGQSLPGTGNQQEEFDWEESSVDAVFLTHYHGDHAGRILEIPKSVPIYMGTATRQIMLNIHKALVRVAELGEEQQKLVELLESERVREISENVTVEEIAGMKITPYSVDHSAYDAYMYLVEAEGKVLLHTGDFRGHGYRGSKMTDVIRYYIHKNGRHVDYLVTEGTMMGERQQEKVMTEGELQKKATKLFREHKYVFLVISSTNLDSLASFHKAAARNRMNTYCYSHYLYQQLKTFSEIAGARSPLYQFENVFVADPDKLMQKQGFLCIVKPGEHVAEWIERFRDKNPLVIYSLWEGYLNPEKAACNQEWVDFFAPYKASGQFVDLHTSGHATPEMLARVIEAVNPQEAIIPMHTENAEGFKQLNISEELKERVRVL